MKPCDIVFNPSTAHNDDGPLERWKAFIKSCRNGGEVWWTGKKTARPGDLCLFWFGAPKHCIAGVGVHDGTVYGKTKWSSPQIGFAVTALSRPLQLDDIHGDSDLRAWWAGNPFWGGPKTIKNP